MANLLTAIMNIYHCPTLSVGTHYQNKNRANSMGDALEHFIKDSFFNSYQCDEETAMKYHEKTFSYLGNTNNPPDIILKNSDAIEVKKIESFTSDLPLNSSYPKAKLYRNSSMLTSDCKKCDGGTWEEKDLIYAVGVVKQQSLKQLCFVYGEDYAASSEIYERIRQQIKLGVLEIPNIEFADTKELGRVNRVDPLGITYLRMRGMWHIKNPFQVFSYVYTPCSTASFNLLAIVNEKKYLTFPEQDRIQLENIPGISIQQKSIKDPNNPAITKNVKIITFSR